MKWLQDNFLGKALLAVIGVFLLVSVFLAIVWALPVSTELAAVATEDNDVSDAIIVTSSVGELDDYEVINEKPVFNESRLPVLADIVDDEPIEDIEIAIKDAPEVKLTGVIITPGTRIASLQPVQGGAESVMAKEGEALIGDYVGWQVSSIQPRSVVLESRDGQTLELELQVHDVKIAEPPKPVVPDDSAQADARQDNELTGEDGRPLSRAEQIRQRIAERREELRQEQEDQQAQSQSPTQSQAASSQQENKPVDYQSAIRAMINKQPEKDSSKDNNDG